MSDEIFRKCLSQFTKNFAYGDAVRHLYRRGYSTERIMREFDYPYTKEELEKIRQSETGDGSLSPSCGAEAFYHRD